MSKFKDKTDAVLAKGAADRGDYTPTGAPLRLYQYWANNGGKAPYRENFCHYWRVVAIWAPLLWLRNKTEPVWSKVTFWVTLVMVVMLALLVGTLVLSPWLGIPFGIMYGLCGVACGVVLNDGDFEDLSERERALRWLLWVTYPVAWATDRFLDFKDNHELSYDTKKKLKKICMWAAMIALGLVFTGGMGTALFGLIESLGIGLGLLSFFGVIAGIIGLVWCMWNLADFLEAKQVVAAEARTEARMLYFHENGKWPEEEPQKPGKLKSFSKGLGEFFVLIFQIIRTKKWKICPIVEIDDAA